MFQAGKFKLNWIPRTEGTLWRLQWEEPEKPFKVEEQKTAVVSIGRRNTERGGAPGPKGWVPWWAPQAGTRARREVQSLPKALPEAIGGLKGLWSSPYHQCLPLEDLMRDCQCSKGQEWTNKMASRANDKDNIEVRGHRNGVTQAAGNTVNFHEQYQVKLVHVSYCGPGKIMRMWNSPKKTI